MTAENRKFANFEGEVAAIEDYDPQTKMFVVRWKNTREYPASIAHLDWCFVYAGLCNANDGGGIKGKAMRSAYYEWRKARAQTGLDEVRETDDHEVLAAYPSGPKKGFVHSLLNLRRIEGNYICPQLAIPTLERLWQENQPKAQEINTRLENGEEIKQQDRTTLNVFNRLDAVLQSARQLLNYDPESVQETLEEQIHELAEKAQAQVDEAKEQARVAKNEPDALTRRLQKQLDQWTRMNPQLIKDPDQRREVFRRPLVAAVSAQRNADRLGLNQPVKPAPAQPPAQDDDPKDPEWQPAQN